ncbi:MAG TPA: addiction module protein [Longimicrobium sp.]
MEYDDIETAALQLPANLRSRLIQRLMDSLDGEEDGGRWIDVYAEQAWMIEIQRRWEEIQRGEATLIDHETVMAELKAKFGDPAAERQ